jgi:predicted dehydrogenase
MEAMWTRFQPAIVRVRGLLADGAIGDVVAVQADLGVSREYDPADRLFAVETGGGALLDLGVYPVSFAQMVLGSPETVAAVGTHAPNGVEVSTSLLLGWDDGRSAILTCSLHSPMPGEARIYGTRGRIDILPRFHHSTAFVLHREGREPEAVSARPIADGYAEELIEATQAFRAGRTESAVMPLDDTLAVMAVLDEAARQLGVDRREAEGIGA